MGKVSQHAPEVLEEAVDHLAALPLSAIWKGQVQIEKSDPAQTRPKPVTYGRQEGASCARHLMGKPSERFRERAGREQRIGSVD